MCARQWKLPFCFHDLRETLRTENNNKMDKKRDLDESYSDDLGSVSANFSLRVKKFPSKL